MLPPIQCGQLMLWAKRWVFRWAPNLGVELTKLSNRRRRIELAVVEAVVPHDRLTIDIGASWGLYTSLLRRSAKAVVAFEPNPDKAEYLHSLFLGTNVTVHQVALSDRSGEAELIVPIGASAFATIEVKNPLAAMTGVGVARISVPCRTLSQFGFQNVGFMKIDVEGHEFSVLSMARELLLRDKPILYVRIEQRHNPTSFGRTCELLNDLGYRGFYSDAWRVVDLRSFDMDRDQPPENAEGSRIRGRYIYNFLFVPSIELDKVFHALRDAGFDILD
jgi:FkbM family methyltransferase